MIEIIVFDLDNTLFDERIYIQNAFKKIAKYIADKYGFNEFEVLNLLNNILAREDPTYPIFDSLLHMLNIPRENLISTLLKIFYNSVDGIIPYEDTIEVLDILSRKYTLILITDGAPITQTKKINVLGIKEFFEKIILVDKVYGKIHRRPSPIPFLDLLKEFRISSEKIAFIGDNIFKDFISPNRLNIHTIRIRRGFYSKYRDNHVPYEFRPKTTTRTLRDILKYL